MLAHCSMLNAEVTSDWLMTHDMTSSFLWSSISVDVETRHTGLTRDLCQSAVGPFPTRNAFWNADPPWCLSDDEVLDVRSNRYILRYHSVLYSVAAMLVLCWLFLPRAIRENSQPRIIIRERRPASTRSKSCFHENQTSLLDYSFFMQYTNLRTPPPSSWPTPS
jgi:hypothetical protein